MTTTQQKTTTIDGYLVTLEWSYDEEQCYTRPHAWVEARGESASWEVVEDFGYLGEEAIYVPVHTQDAIEDWLDNLGYFS